jgi:hypothetical protein
MKGSSPLALIAVALIFIGAGMAGAGVLLPYNNVKLPLSSVGPNSVDILASYPGVIYPNQAVQIHAGLLNLMGPPRVSEFGNQTLSLYINGQLIESRVTDNLMASVIFQWTPPAVGNYAWNITWAGDSNYPSGLFTAGSIGVTLPPSHAPGNSTVTVGAPNPYMKYVNFLSISGALLLVVGALTLPFSIYGRKPKK